MDHDTEPSHWKDAHRHADLFLRNPWYLSVLGGDMCHLTPNIPGKIGHDSRKLQMPATWYGQVVSDGTVSYHRPSLHARFGFDSA